MDIKIKKIPIPGNRILTIQFSFIKRPETETLETKKYDIHVNPKLLEQKNIMILT